MPALLDHFLNMFNKKLNKNVTAISEDVKRIFMSCSWPGNIRELQNTLEFAIVLCHGSTITIKDLSPEFLDRNKAVSGSVDKNAGERKAILHALKESGWNKSKAARRLGIDRKTIYTKITKYNIVEDRA
jgi:transcriptional regulator of acetoin/glycerol metabolism